MPDLLIDDEVTRALVPRFERAAELIREALAEGRPLIVRYDGDADGISSAFSLVEAIEGLAKEKGYDLGSVRTVQGEAAIYFEGDARLDAGNAAGLEVKPLVVFLDHAGNPESVPGLAILREAGFSLIVVDHHPTRPRQEEQLADVFVSPFAFTERGSEYPTALLAYEVAKRVWPAQASRREYAEWGLQADASPFRPKELLREPIVLDYLAKYNEDASSLPRYRRAMGNPAEVGRLYRLATEKTKEALERAERYTKAERRPGLTLVLLKLGFLRSRWPSKREVLNLTHERSCNRHPGPLVTLGYGGDKLMFRVSTEAHAKGFRSNEFIAELKKEFPEVIKSGGGHERAAAVRVGDPAMLKPVVERAAALIRKRYA
jgi:RecJ-like exonuclease